MQGADKYLATCINYLKPQWVIRDQRERGKGLIATVIFAHLEVITLFVLTLSIVVYIYLRVVYITLISSQCRSDLTCS